jgi:hypothetical protein
VLAGGLSLGRFPEKPPGRERLQRALSADWLPGRLWSRLVLVAVSSARNCWMSYGGRAASVSGQGGAVIVVNCCDRPFSSMM